MKKSNQISLVLNGEKEGQEGGWRQRGAEIRNESAIKKRRRKERRREKRHEKKKCQVS